MKADFPGRASAVLDIPASLEKASVVVESISPECSFPASSRSVAQVVEGRGKISLRVEAEDSTALRAALNSYIRWIDVVLETVSTVKER